jgi:hypothetical protein
MSEMGRTSLKLVIGMVAVLLCLPHMVIAQPTSAEQAATGQAVIEEQVRSGEVVAVSGNDLFVRMEDGQVKKFTPPPGAKFNVDGQEVTLDQLKPGTKLTQTIKTTSTPRTVRTVTSIKGKVWHVSPPNTIVLSLPDGTNRQYQIPEGQKFNVGGQMVDAFALQKGMQIDATLTKEVPEVVVTEEKAVTGQAPAAPEPEPAPAQEAAQAPPPTEPAAPAPQAPEEPARAETLPATATPLPLLGLIGVLSLLSAGALRRRLH